MIAIRERRCWMRMRYRVELSQDERDELRVMLGDGNGNHAKRKLKRALILLVACQGVSEKEIASISGASRSTVYRTKRRFVEGDLEAALNEDPRAGMTRPYAKELYASPLNTYACPVCGCVYVEKLPEDQKYHRSVHGRTLSVFRTETQ